MSLLRIGTFNVENLFSRAKALNMSTQATGSSKLNCIADLQIELEKATYDKVKIINLYKQVKAYISINVIRSGVGQNIIGQRKGQYHVSANGKNDWFGYIEFTRDKFDDVSMKNSARVIQEIDAHILCLIEVEDRPTLSLFNSDLLNILYPYNMLLDGNDPRGIDVSLLSKFELGEIRTNIFDGTPKSRTFSRDCLEVELIMQNGKSIYFLVNHLKSKSGMDQKRNDERRKAQAERVLQILQTRYDLKTQYVVVAGDFNDTPDNPPLAPLLNSNALHDVLKLQYPDNPDERWTYHYKKNEQIDYILVSDPLRKAFKKAGVLRKGIADVYKYSSGKEKSYPSVTSWRNAASDHGAVWAEFDL